MLHLSLSRSDASGVGTTWAPDALKFFRAVAIPLLVGIVLGSLIGQFSSAPSELVSLSDFREVDAPAFETLLEIWRCVRFPLAAVLLSTSFLGIVLIPALSAYRGFLLGCSVAAAFQSRLFQGLLLSALTIGVPGILGLPAFLFAASDSACVSDALLRFVRMQPYPLSNRSVICAHAALIVLLCAAEFLYSCLLLPVLLQALP